MVKFHPNHSCKVLLARFVFLEHAVVSWLSCMLLLEDKMRTFSDVSQLDSASHTSMRL